MRVESRTGIATSDFAVPAVAGRTRGVLAITGYASTAAICFSPALSQR
jgi:hypothetical protein